MPYNHDGGVAWWYQPSHSLRLVQTTASSELPTVFVQSFVVCSRVHQGTPKHLLQEEEDWWCLHQQHPAPHKA